MAPTALQAPGRAIPATEALLRRYAAYRLRQGRELLELLPREGRREVIRACRSRGEAEGSIEELAAFCAGLLPLPPFHVWLADFQAHQASHLSFEDPAVAGPRSPDGSPVVVGVKELSFRGRPWVAQLLVSPVDGLWQGAIQFHGDGRDDTVRTGCIFRETTVETIRDRFRAFDEITVAAFLRSALP